MENRWFIKMPLTSVESERRDGYNFDVPPWHEHYRERAKHQAVGFLTYSSKKGKDVFVPGKPHKDYGYINIVYVIEKSGYVRHVRYAEVETTWMEAGAILIGMGCNYRTRGLSLCEQKAKLWNQNIGRKTRSI